MHDHHRYHANAHHHHPHDHDRNSGVSGYGLAPAPGHNAVARLAQWQEPHRHEGRDTDQPEADFDLIEKSFAEHFPKASDPTSFLRLARVPFVGRHPDGRVLRLLRVEYEEATDVGSVMPHVGGETFRYDPLPAQLVSTRRHLRFVYQDGDSVLRLTLAETRGLAEDET